MCRTCVFLDSLRALGARLGAKASKKIPAFCRTCVFLSSNIYPECKSRAFLQMVQLVARKLFDFPRILRFFHNYPYVSWFFQKEIVYLLPKTTKIHHYEEATLIHPTANITAGGKC